MAEAHRRKICLSISQIKCNNEKTPSFLGMKFSTAAIFSRRHAVIFLSASRLLFFFHTRIAGICVRLLSQLVFFFFALVPSIKKRKIAALCMWHVWSAARPQLKPRDKNIIAVSAGRKRIRAPQTGPFPILMGQTCEACGASGLDDWEDFSQVVGRGSGCFLFFDHQQSLTWSADKWKKKTAFVCNSNCFTTVSPPTTPQCQRQALSRELHSADPPPLFFFPIASEEGSRCKITGLPESGRFELELRVRSSRGMKSCRRLGALCWSSRGYLGPSQAGFVLQGLLLPPALPAATASRRQPTPSAVSQAPAFPQPLLPWQREERLKTSLKEWQQKKRL